MDNIKIKIVANPLYGTTGSLVTLPFMGQVVHTKTVDAADIQKLIDAEHPQMTDPLAELTANQLLTYGADKIADEEKRFNFGSDYFAFEPAISGSVATADAKLGEDNTPYINVVNGTALGNRLAAIIPSIVKEDLGDVMFHSVESVKDGESVKNTIYSGSDFTFIGKRLSFAAADEKLELRHPTTGAVASAVTVKGGDTLGQRITAALATPPEASGTYKLYAQSHGKDTPDANIKSGTITVDYVYVAPTEPTITKIASSEGEGKVKAGAPVMITGYGISPDDLGEQRALGVKYEVDGDEEQERIENLGSYDAESRTWTLNMITLGYTPDAGSLKFVFVDSSAQTIESAAVEYIA